MKSEAKSASPKGFRGAVKKVSYGARVLDAILAVVFAYLAFKSSTSFWIWAFALSSAFCVFTAISSPIEKLQAFVVRQLTTTRKA